MESTKVKRLLVIALTATLIFNGNVMLSAQTKEVNSYSTQETRSKSDVIEISTEEDLKKISEDLTGNYKLKNNIKLSGKEWTSINDLFEGTFDGAGYTISNLYSSDAQSLFEDIGVGGVVKNLTISGKVIADYDAALLAHSNHGTIINCISVGSVTQKKFYDNAYNLGGMVICNFGYMKNCVNKATVAHAYDKNGKSGVGGVGGICAQQDGTLVSCVNEAKITSNASRSGGIAGSNNGLIKDCTNKGDIVVNNNQTNTSVGGVVGSNYGAIYNCINQNNVSVTTKDVAYSIGGICGKGNEYSELINCKNSGNIKGFNGNIGGICGELYNVVGGSSKVLISSCVNDGKVSSTAISGCGSMAGGVIGEASCDNGTLKILNCMNNGNVSGSGSSLLNASGVVGFVSANGKGDIACQHLINNGTVNSEKDANGIISGDANNNDSPIVLTNCVNHGSISAERAYGIGEGWNVSMDGCCNTGDIYGDILAGGITGEIYNYNCIENVYNLGNITGAEVAGIGRTISDKATLVNAYNAGTLKGSSCEWATIRYFGAQNYKNCYYLEQDFLSDNQIGTVVKSADLQKQATYAGFDFNTIWTMKEQNGRLLPGFKDTNTTTQAILAKNAVSLGLGETSQLKAKKGKIFSLRSENPKIVAVESGVAKITAKNSGTTNVYAIFDDGQILTCKVTVNKIDISKANIVLDSTKYYYDGKAKKPGLKVHLGKKTLKDDDYVVSYNNNKKIGTATVTVKGTGDYSGTIKKTFEITVKKGSVYKVDKNKYKITSSSTVAFTGLGNTETTKFTIPKTVTIGGKKFKVTSIGTSAFKDCTKLSKVTIGSNVTSIGTKAFKGCKVLKSITVPSKVTTIGKEAFHNCSKLGTITMKTTKLKSVGKNAFKGIKSTAKIKVPSKKVSAYKKLMKGKGQSNKVKITK